MGGEVVQSLYVTLNNFMHAKNQRDLDSYEELTYNQLLVTARTHARLNELVMQQHIEEMKDGKGTDQTTGGATPQSPEPSEHRDDDPPSTV